MAVRSARERLAATGAVGLVLLTSLAGCSRSADQVRALIEGKPGVGTIKIDSHPTGLEGLEGPDAHDLVVHMDESSTAEQVEDVFASLDDAIDDEDVTSVRVVLCCNGATLAINQDQHATREMVDDLLAAAHDDQVREYLFTAYAADDHDVEITLAPAPFSDVVAAADRWRDTESLTSVSVVSGGFLLIRAADYRPTDRRERFVEQVLERFPLTGAGVTGRSPLQLFVAPEDAAAVRRYVAREGAHLSNVVVTTRRPPWGGG